MAGGGKHLWCKEGLLRVIIFVLRKYIILLLFFSKQALFKALHNDETFDKPGSRA